MHQLLISTYSPGTTVPNVARDTPHPDLKAHVAEAHEGKEVKVSLDVENSYHAMHVFTAFGATGTRCSPVNGQAANSLQNKRRMLRCTTPEFTKTR